MNIIDKFLIKSTKSGSLRDVKLALSLNNIKNSFEKFFFKISPFRDRASFNVSGDQTLTQALEYAVTNLDHNVMKLLTDAGANVNAIGSDSIGSVKFISTIELLLMRKRRLCRSLVRSISRTIRKNVV